ncbi:MAG: hypothetical protein EXQ58_00035 [Acidobacteria bacterium]|nr:hypothetical protein [Acidobacteriota bacterium]
MTASNMRFKLIYAAPFVLLCLALVLEPCSPLAAPSGSNASKKLIDIVYVWGTPVGNNAYDLPKGKMLRTDDPAKFAEADPHSRASLLGVHNVFMAGDGLSNDMKTAEAQSEEVSQMKRIIWELTPNPPFLYTPKVTVLKSLKKRYPQIEAIVLDDMMTSQKNRGLRPKHVAALRQEMAPMLKSTEMYGVVYTKNFNDPLLPEYIPSLDGFLLAEWQAEEIPKLKENVATLSKMAPAKPIILALYLYDYGKNRKMPRELMKMQCEKALDLAKQGRIKGIVFVLVNNDPETVVWTRDWIREHAGDPIVVH